MGLLRKKPEGSGRRKGSLNRKTQAIAKDMIASGALTPLEVMMKAMLLHVEAGRWPEAAAVAKDAAPYIHPRLAAIHHSGAVPGAVVIENNDARELLVGRILSIAAKSGNGEDTCGPLQ